MLIHLFSACFCLPVGGAVGFDPQTLMRSVFSLHRATWAVMICHRSCGWSMIMATRSWASRVKGCWFGLLVSFDWMKLDHVKHVHWSMFLWIRHDTIRWPVSVQKTIYSYDCIYDLTWRVHRNRTLLEGDLDVFCMCVSTSSNNSMLLFWVRCQPSSSNHWPLSSQAARPRHLSWAET